MDFKIEGGPVFTILRVNLQAGENIKAEAGAMVAMSPSIELKAKTTGKGFLGAIGAMVGGESLFSSVFTANAAGELLITPATPGDIVHVKLAGQTLMAQAGAYLAGTVDLQISAQGSLKALIGGEGLFLSKITGTGDLFLGSYGAILMKELAPGEVYIVDTGHMVAWESQVQYKLKKAAKGLFSTMASGEGLVGEYTGPGKLWLQTRNLSALAGILAPMIVRS
ncbi:MAG: TIGR00266 family protein [Spirochaetes bacterium GWF1_49_6]|jgi:uncharacterized protein (TIGR00266 family)|nr:MAG: TIGR00266 family protein [Spirochaetes bacterium GWF1_49_6]